MTTNGYIINAVLVLLVLRQIRERRLDLQSLLLPVALVAGAGAYFLHGIPGGGNDVFLEAALAGLGAVMGVLAGLTTHVRPGSDGVALGRAGVVAAGLWVSGVGTDGIRVRRRSRARPVGPQLQHPPPGDRLVRVGCRPRRLRPIQASCRTG